MSHHDDKTLRKIRRAGRSASNKPTRPQGPPSGTIIPANTQAGVHQMAVRAAGWAEAEREALAAA